MRVGLLSLLAWPAVGDAQLAPPHRPVRFVRSEVEPFLPQSSVYDIHQDRQGFLWFGTREGVGRWDGYEMRTWKARPFRDDGLPDNVVRQIVEDRQGSLWLVVVADNFESSRVARLVGPAHERVETFPQRDAIPVADAEGVAWLVALDSLYRFDESSGRFVGNRARPPGGGAASGAMFDRTGVLWVGTARGILERYDPDGLPPTLVNYYLGEHQADIRFQRFLEDADGTIWITGRGLRRLDPTRSRVEAVPGAPVAFDTTGSSNILQDPDGWLWLATVDGVYRFDRAMTRVERFSLQLPGNLATQNWVVGLLRDQAGAIWAGTVWGLHRYDPATAPFGFLAHDPDDPNTLSGGIILPLLEDVTGALWAGSLGGGVNRIEPRSGRVTRYRTGTHSGLPHDWVWSLADAGEGRAWVGTESGLAQVDPARSPAVRRIPVEFPASALSRGIYALLPDSAGGVWMGVSTGLLYLDRAGRTVSSNLDFAGTVGAIRRHGDLLWIGTSAGLVRYNPRTAEHLRFGHDAADSTSLSHDVVLAVHVDRLGRVWVGTNSGLNWLDPDHQRFHLVQDAAELQSGAIYSILEDDQGRLWLGSNRGLVRYDPSAPAARRLRRYNAASGTGNVEFNRGSGLRGRDGTFYFGGDQGLTVFYPAELADNPFVPPIVLTGVQRASRDGVEQRRYAAADEPVVLAPDDYTVSFTFAALSFTYPERNQYAYRMEGFDPQWIAAGTARTASYTNLPPGSYTFRVRGSNDAGVWNEVGLAVPVVVRPWFWETLWFRGLLGVAVIALVSVGTARAQRGRHRRELATLAYRQAIEAERARISRDMHDEVGAGLTEIAMLGDLTLRERDGGAVHRAAIGRIATRSRQMLDALGEIVWAINPDHDRAERVAPYFREYAADYLESAGLDASLRFDTGGWTGTISAELRRQLFLVLKEALANAVRHGQATRVEVEFVVQGGRLRFVVADDGRGFDPGQVADAEARGHHGLANLRRRAAALGGALEVSSAPGQGTRLVLIIAALPGGIPSTRSGP